MNPILLLLIIPPLLVAAFCRWKWHETISWGEAAVQAIVPVLLIAGVWSISTYSATLDYQTINGQVTGKGREWTFCSHSYSCRCRSVRSGKTTRTVCDTCYHHSNDWNWRVDTTVGPFYVEREDWQGAVQPARWSIVQNGQPMARPLGYTNYVKGAPDSVFHPVLDFHGKLPEYPGWYDYQYSDRVIGDVPYLSQWNRQLAMNLRTLGAQRQVNYLIVFTKNSSPRFADALKSKWLGGKKNDVVVVVGLYDYPRVRWVRVFSWSKNDIVNVAIRNAIRERGVVHSVETNNLVASIIRRDYVRRPMADFEYLKDDVEPSVWVMMLALIFGLAASAGLAAVFHRN